MSVFIKAAQVIKSCETLEQLRVADKYIDNAFKKDYLSISEYLRLSSDLNKKIMESNP